jgi:integrase
VEFIRLGLNTGMRKGEMLGLEWHRVDLDAGLVYLGSEHQKNGKHGSIPLNSVARSALVNRAKVRDRYCPDSPWVFCTRQGERIRDIKKSFATACEKAGIHDFHLHDLRHTCATWLVQAGVSIREVAELLRHSNIQVTMRYAHLAPENVRNAVEKLEMNESRFSHSNQNDL